MRLDGLDIARFLAFVGMVLVNFRIVSGTGFGGDYASALTHGLEGRAAALFVVLAGVGLSLAKPSASLLLKRAAFLFALGMIDLLIFEADILHFYAIYFVVAALFLGASNLGLMLGAAAFVLIAVLGLVFLDYEAHWDWETLNYAGFWTVEGFLRHTFFNGWHPVFPWAAFMLIGMRIGRLGLGERPVQLSLLFGGILLSWLAGWPAALVTSDPELSALLGTAPLPPGPMYILAGSGSACAVMALCLLIAPWLKRMGVAPVLTAPGGQTLTLYALHILLGMGVMDLFGWTGGALSSAQVFWGSLGFCAVTAIYALAWRRLARRGPLEILMRQISG